MRLYAIAILTALSLASTPTAYADDDDSSSGGDYNSGYDAGRGNYDPPDNSSSSDYYQGYETGKSEREDQNKPVDEPSTNQDGDSDGE